MLNILFALAIGGQDLASRAQTLADTFVKDNVIAGASVAAVQDGKLIFAIGAGFANVEKRTKVSPETLIRLGSISKPVTAVGAMQLVAKGKLSLDSPIAMVVPEWPKDKPTITLRQLLTHTSGIRHYKSGLDPTGAQFKTYTSAEALGLFAKDDLVFEPGTNQAYSTHAFTVVARAIETASGKPFVSYMRDRVFGDKETELDCEVASDAKPQRSDLYATNGNKTTQYTRREDNSWKYGGGGMEATARGLAGWGDRLRTGRILADKQREEMWTQAKLSVPNKQTYGLGWRVDGRVVSHGGAQQGCRTHLMIDLDRKLTIVVLTNTSGNHAPQRLADGLAALFPIDKASVR